MPFHKLSGLALLPIAAESTPGAINFDAPNGRWGSLYDVYVRSLEPAPIRACESDTAKGYYPRGMTYFVWPANGTPPAS